MALSRDIVIRLLGDADSAVKAQKAAADAAEVTVQQYRKAEREYDRQQRAIESASRKQRKAMEDVGRASVVAGAAIVAGLGMAIKAAVNWESAWTGVLKTVNGTPEQLSRLEDGLRGLTRVLPATHEEIAAVAEAAGQLGVQTESIVDFTRVMINLGETTNLSADEAATSLAQLMNVMQTAPDDVDRLGSTLVALGNAGASTEADIVRMASYISGSARLIGASESDVLALANAMTSMGINAERGGGVMTRVMQDVYAAVQTGGDQLENFARVAGVSSAEFARQFRADPIAAIDSFIQGLNTVEQSGGNVVETLGNLGYVGTQDTAVLLQLKGAGDLLTDSLGLGNEAWEQNTALVQEAAKRYDTTAAKTELARNAINDAAIDIGEAFLPVMASLAESVADVAKWFSDLPGPIKNVLAGLAGVAGVGALVGGAFLLIAPRVMDTYKAFQQLSSSSPRAAAGLRAVGKAAGAALAITAVTSAVDGLIEATRDAPPSMEAVTDALLNMGDAGSKGLSDLDVLLAKTVPGVRDMADAAQRLTDPSFTQGLEDAGSAFSDFFGIDTGQGAALRDQIAQIGDSLALMVDSGNAELAATQFETLLTEWERGGGTQRELLELMPAYADALKGIDNDQQAATESARLQAEQARTLAENTDFVYGSLQGYAQALGLSEEATQELIDKSNELGESLGGFVDPLATYTTMLQEKAQAEADSANAVAESTGAQSTSWEDYVDSVDVAFDEYLAALEQQVADQAAWEQNMLALAGRVSQGTLDELARMGPEGAPLVADLVNASDEELSRFDDVTAARSKEATDAWGQQLTLAQPVLAQIARTAGQDVVDGLAEKLANGTTTVAEIARQYGIELAGGINPVLTALGRPSVHLSGLNGFNTGGGYAVGGYTGPGGKYTPAGIVHAGEVVWSQDDVAAHGGVANVEAMRRSRNGYASGGYVTAEDVPRPYSTAPYGAPLSTAGDAAMDTAYEATTKWLRETGPIGSAVAWARSQVGKPYIWGGVGPEGYDCSGFMSAITNVLLGLSPYSRRGATANFPWPGFLPGDGLFTVGSTRDAGGGIGHMAGTLQGVNVESRGGQGVVVGSSARGAHDGLFNTRAHLATYHTGVDYVPRTGLAMLQEGERVIPREMNRIPVGGMASRPIVVNIEGAVIAGMLEIGGDGLARIIDGRVVRVLDVQAQQIDYHS